MRQVTNVLPSTILSNDWDQIIEQIIDRIIDQTIDQTIDQIIDRIIDQTIDQRIDQIIDQIIDQTIDQTIDQIIDQIICKTFSNFQYKCDSALRLERWLPPILSKLVNESEFCFTVSQFPSHLCEKYLRLN